ncbi:orotidine-5'-phosphate decarboxylase [Rathayibacter soli]|uniref:orotidine-5'-phosphate decarboxylase n=1 Tax=Rathayibacter soli TaxID=3144168 RepID=UPI0027E56F72|nr:orotidine-5'-phosphate decarboxylase [Glaciibacter superstes]
MSAEISFGARLTGAFTRHGRLCVGIDPHAFLLEAWGLPVSAAGVREFGLRVIDAAAGNVGIVKPQVAFFERFGSAGYAALEAVLAAARTADLLVIADAKRGDLGTSVEAYAQAWLTPGSPLEADAMTVSAFQGVGSLSAPMAIAHEAGKGLFVLAATSNPESIGIQQGQVTGEFVGTHSVSRVIIDDVIRFNAQYPAEQVGGVGVVLGATLDFAAYGIDTSTQQKPGLAVLAPGFGHQGAKLADASRIYGSLLASAIVSESRSVLSVGPDLLPDAIAKRSRQVQDAIA